MAPRRHSRGAAIVLSDHERKIMIAAANGNPALRETLETVVGVKWESLTDADKLTHLVRHEEIGFASNSMAAAAKGRQALERVAEEIKYGVTLEDRAQLLEADNERLRTALAESEAQREKLRKQVVELTAQPAAAVHSDAA